MLRLLRLANPVVRLILRSPAHGLLSWRLLLLGYTGRRSGRNFEIPLRYAETGDGRFVAVAVRPARKLWWRSLSEPTRAFLIVRGERRSVTASLAEGAERDDALARYVEGRERVGRLTRDAAVVVFAPTR